MASYIGRRKFLATLSGAAGNPGGSLEATRRSFNKDFLLALAADFKKHGGQRLKRCARRSLRST